MAITSTNIKEKYLRKLNEFQNSNLKTVEQQRIQALTLLTEAFEGRKYIHLPIIGERASRIPMDDVFTTIQDNHVAIEAALAVLVTNTNSLEKEINKNEDELETLLDILEIEITTRALNTDGQEKYERQIVESFKWPLTLSPESEADKTAAGTDIIWEPNDPAALTWIGDIGIASGDPLIQGLDDLLYGEEIMVQHIAWSGNADLSKALFVKLQTALDNISSSGQLASMNDFFIVSYTGVESLPTDNPDGGGILKVILETPELISHIQLTTIPADLVDHVIIINYQGVPTMYQMIENHLFIRPTVVQEIHFYITGGIVGQPLEAFFTAIINYIEISGGSPHAVGYFIDRTSAILRDEPVLLTVKKDSAKTKLKQGKSALSEIRTLKSAKKIPELKTDIGRSLLNTLKIGTAIQKTLEAKNATDINSSVSTRKKKVTTPKDSAKKSKARISSNKTTTKNSPKDDRKTRGNQVSPKRAKPSTTPPKKSSNRKEKKTNTPTGTKELEP